MLDFDHDCDKIELQVGDQIVEINGEATQGITHTRAIELIQAGGNKVHLLLRAGQGLVPDHSESQLKTPSTWTTHVWLLGASWFLCMCCKLLSLTFIHTHDLSCCLSTLLFLFFSARLSVSTSLCSSSCRSELFFHPVLLHETRASIKASLLFLGLSLITLVNLRLLLLCAFDLYSKFRCCLFFFFFCKSLLDLFLFNSKHCLIISLISGGLILKQWVLEE